MDDLGMTQIPEGDWYCTACVALTTTKTTRSRGRTKKVTINDNTLATDDATNATGRKRTTRGMTVEKAVEESSEISTRRSTRRAKA